MAEGRASLVIPHHRRSHLKSETVSTYLRILSLCGAESHSSHTLPVASDALNSGVDSVESEKITNQEAQNENLSIENGLMSNKSDEVISIEPTMLVVEKDVIGDEVVASINNNHCDRVEESVEGFKEIELDDIFDFEIEESREGVKGFELNDFLDFDISETINPPEDTQVQILSEENVVEKEAHEMQQEKTGLTKPVNSDATVDNSVCLVTDADIEDGEIPDDLGVYGQSIDLLDEDSASHEEMKVGEDHTPGEVSKQRDSDNAQTHVVSTLSHSGATDSTNATMQEELAERKSEEKHVRDDMLGSGRSEDIEQANRDDRMLEARRNAKGGARAIGNVNAPLIYHDNFLYPLKTSDSILTVDQGSAPKVKGTEVGEKMKRTVTKERKEKKKRNKRKKRAEMNKELGVKRLKIEPISKPKVVKYCEFFLKGRCQKGDSCKFSHDTIPLTKSKPCTFFARNLCMKGDNCPFDHQLFKYPCDNIKTKGECIRGDKCMFSHKIMESPAPSSDITQTEAGSQSLSGNSNTRGHQNTNNTYSQTLYNVSKETSLGTPSSSIPLVHRNPMENVSGRPKTSAQASKDLTFLPFGSSPRDNSNKKDIPKDHNASAKPQNSNESGRLKTPAQAPKGMVFLSYGNSPTDDSNNKDAHKDQNASGKPQSSNDLLWKTPATPLILNQSSTNPSPSGQSNNSAQRALSSTLAFAAKYEKEMMNGRAICSPGPSNEANKTSKSSTSSGIDNIQNGWMKASPLLQEFLFGAGGDGKL